MDIIEAYKATRSISDAMDLADQVDIDKLLAGFPFIKKVCSQTPTESGDYIITITTYRDPKHKMPFCVSVSDGLDSENFIVYQDRTMPYIDTYSIAVGYAAKLCGFKGE